MKKQGTPPQGQLYTGWAQTDITPDRPVRLAGQFHERISTHVQSRLTATVMVLETRSESGESLDQAMMIGCDLGGISEGLQDEVRLALEGKLPGFDLRKLFLNATHTHTAPVMIRENVNTVTEHLTQFIPEEMRQEIAKTDDEKIMPPGEYRDFFIEKVCKAAISAWNAMTPSKASWELGRAVIGHNRRVRYDDGATLMYGNTNTPNYFEPEGPSDSGVELLYIWNMDDTLKGVAVCVPCPSQVVEGQYYVSADYWGEVRRQLAQRYEGDLFILPLCGSAGDIAPRDMARRKRGEPNMHEEEGAIELGKRLLNVILSHIDTAATHKTASLPFAHCVMDLNLPLRTVGRLEYERAKAEFEAILTAKAPGQRLESKDMYALHTPGGIMDRYVSQQKSTFYPVEVHIMRLGDIAFSTSPFELFMEYAMQMRARAKAEQLFSVQLACGRGKYLPTQKAIDGGHYSAIVASGFVGPAGGKYLVESTLQAINAMWGDES